MALPRRRAALRFLMEHRAEAGKLDLNHPWIGRVSDINFIFL